MNPKYHLLIAVAALSLGACSTDDTCTEPEIGGYKISFTVAEDTETRTTLEMLDAGNFLRWVSTDKVGIYTRKNSNGDLSNSNISTVADVSKSPVEFVGTLEQPVSSGDMFYAYYPYDVAQGIALSSEELTVGLSIPAEQKQTKAGVYNGESNPLVAVPMELSQDWGNAGHISSVRFRPLGAIVELRLYSSDETLRSESIHSVAFESKIPLAGDFSFNLKSVTVKDALPISGYESKTVTTTLKEVAVVPATKDEAARVYLTIAPGRYTGRIVVTTNEAQYTFTLAKAITFDRAAIKGLPADLAKAERKLFSDDPITFEDPEVKQICVDNWDTNKNGELSYKEAAAVTDLKEVFKSNSDVVNSFNELQYFTGLQTIGNSAFYGCSGLTSVTIPEGVTSIGNSAFYYCGGLKSITIPEGVTSIGQEAFGSCSGLTSSVHIPETVTSIGEGAFSSCNNMPSINIPAEVTTIERKTFSGCGGLKSITIPEKVTSIGNSAFYNCSGLTSIHIPDGVTSIGEQAFYNCSGLTSIHIPDGVTSIGEQAFYYCTRLTSITIPKGVTTIEKETFYYCNGLTSINLNGVTTIGERAFGDCSSLTSVNIPETVTSIGSYAFSGCSSLTSINIPETVTTIGEYAFSLCSKLTSINIPAGVTTIGSGTFSRCSSLTSIHIPEKVTSIGGYAFRDCSSLTSINIPDGVTAIEMWTFNGCSNLTSINIPERVTTIGESAFENCSSLTSITIPEKVTKIGYGVFSSSGLTSITIPEGVTEINSSAFSQCRSLTSVYCKPTTPPTLGSWVFSDTPSTMQIYVPTASVDAYKAADGWVDYTNQIFADNN